MEKYLLLRLTVRYGVPAAILIALAAAAATLWLAYAGLGLGAVVLALFAGLLVFAAIKSYVELVVLITDMLIPQ